MVVGIKIVVALGQVLRETGFKWRGIQEQFLG